MTMKEKIIETLRGNKLTIKEITDRINKKYPINTTEARIRMYIWRLKNEDKTIEKCGIDNRYKIYKLISDSDIGLKQLLKALYVLMNSKMDFIETPENSDIELIKQIEMVIK